MHDFQRIAIVALIVGALLLAAAFFVWLNTSEEYEARTTITVRDLVETVIQAHARTEECTAAHAIGKPPCDD